MGNAELYTDGKKGYYGAAQSFIDNFKNFEEYASEEIMEGAPILEAIKN